MKATIALVVLLVAALAVIFYQHQSQEKLHADADALTQSVSQLHADNDNLSKQLAAATETHPLSDKEKTELMKLRGEVGGLQNQVKSLRGEQEKLKQSAQAAQSQSQKAQAQIEAAQSQLAAARRAAAANPAPSPASPEAMMNSCINHLRQMDAAKNQWALENSKTADAVPTERDIAPYIKLDADGNLPKCPAGGVYTLNAVSASPTCSIAGHVLP